METFLYGAHAPTPGCRQHYLRYGGKGEPLILLPGITSPAITWGFVAQYLGQHFDTYVVDIRGRGLSSCESGMDYSADRCAEDVIALADALGLSRFHLMGHSMGARFALRANELGLADKLSSLCLIDPPVSGPGRRRYPSQLPWYVDSIRQAREGMDAEAMRAYCPTWTPEQLALRAEWLHTCDEQAVVQAFNDFHEIDIHPSFASIRTRALLIVAGLGGVIEQADIDEIRALAPLIEVMKVASAGHMIPWDDLPGFLKVVGSFYDIDFDFTEDSCND
ncbi:alpha/beta fold hydrolase [Halopseudomonas xiamenensis]|uniref:alpha/beta fold hydrolase n=1 Tax=Halopseudomonas xiamenensis TaxID=157792 RepID=UPI001629C928|nr:alpha/beta hydrolase [Halopseudomonas xiamenensis]